MSRNGIIRNWTISNGHINNNEIYYLVLQLLLNYNMVGQQACQLQQWGRVR